MRGAQEEKREKKSLPLKNIFFNARDFWEQSLCPYFLDYQKSVKMNSSNFYFFYYKQQKRE